MDTSIVVALIAASATGLGWIVSHELALRRSDSDRRVAAQTAFLARQLEELYGPLLAQVLEGRATFLDLLHALGRGYVFEDGKALTEGELKTWLFWAETDFLPRNDRIKMLLTGKTHLIDGPEFPAVYVAFLDHANSWALNHRRWKEEGVAYSWRSNRNWPVEFETAVESTFAQLKKRQAELLETLRARPA